jgi:hypothetical protein
MATSTDKRPPPLSGGGQAGRKVSDGTGNMIAYIIAGIAVLFGGYYLYTTYYSPTPVTPAVTDGTAPKQMPPVAATPAAPPVAPATPPATTTTP